MRKRDGAFLILSTAGWAVAAIVGLREYRAATVTDCDPGSRPEVVGAEVRAPRAQSTPQPGAHQPVSEVYVRPHPDGLALGRWVRFSSFVPRVSNGVEFVDLRLGGEVVSVPSEAIDWPQQRAVQAYR